MKKVFVRRHAPKHATGELTAEGRQLAQKFHKKTGVYHIVIASDKPRAIETAILLTGIEPIIDTRAGTPPFTSEQEEELHEKGEKHPQGIAGVIFEILAFKEMVITQGRSLVDLIEETLVKLPPDTNALIISHDGVMVAAEKILVNESLEKADKTFQPLTGFVVSEDGMIEYI